VDYAVWERGKSNQNFFLFAIIVETNLNRKIKIWISLMKLGATTGCHQMHERSFSIKGYQFPVCARCTGLGLGQFLGLALYPLYIQCNLKTLLILDIIFIAMLGIDGLGQLKKLWVSTNRRRFLTGLFCGFFAVSVVVKLTITVYTMLKK
jgi:uncharacterized membrane protein